MICRKCGADIPDNSIRCSNCGIKVNMLCPECKSLTKFGNRFCSNCGFELIKICPNCNASNVYSAKTCRKCNTVLIEEISQTPETEIVKPFSYNPAEFIILGDDSSVNPVPIEEPIVEAHKNTDHSFESFEVDFQQKQKLDEETNETENEEVFISSVSQEDDKYEQITTDIVVYDEQVSSDEEQDDTSETIEDSYNQNEKTDEEESSDNIQYIEDENESETSEENTNFEEYEEYSEPEEETYETETDTNNNEEDSEDNFEEYNDEKYSEEQSTDEEEYSIEHYKIQEDTLKQIVQTIKSSLDKHILAVTGNEGCGKSAVLKQAANILSDEGYISLYGNCTPLSQITSFGFFQDAFLRMMGFPPFTTSSEQFIKDFKKSSFVNAFNFLNADELYLFLNLLYPVMTDEFKNILDNKEQMFSILEKVIKSFLVNSNIIIAIDNFELLDGASYDFIMHLLKNNCFNNRLKLLAAYKENKSIESYFDTTNIDDKIFETFPLEKLGRYDLINTVNNSVSFNIEDILPEDLINEIIQRTNGNAIRMEQEIAFLFDINYICIENNEIYLNEDNKPENSPQSVEELIRLRLNTLIPGAKNVLFMAAIMGYRFSTNILCLAVTMPNKKAAEMIEFLKEELFINTVDNYTCEFKSLSVWKLIYQEAKADLLFKENCQHLYETLKPLILSSNLQKLISCKDALTKEEEFDIWQDTANISSKLGDTNLFVISRKQCLKVLDEQDFPEAEQIRSLIYEQLGKLLTEKSPSESVTYLANVLDIEIKSGNINKVIDISGYFINSCNLTGNYYGITEAVDSILSVLTKNNTDATDIEIALIQTRKLKALLNIGNTEQVINLVKDEILPEIEKELQQKDQLDNSYKNIIIDAKILSDLSLVKALAIQGNSEVFDRIDNLKQFIIQNDYRKKYYLTQTELIEAFAKTTIGHIEEAKKILADISNKYTSSVMEPNLLAEWNLINVLTKVFLHQTKELKSDLFEIAAFANNINEHFIKNIIKLILGCIILEEGDTIKALEIFNEEITYFAKEKVAIGALLAWALIVKISIKTGDIDKALNTATKALEIAQSPKINNYFFILYFQMLLAEIYFIKNDLVAVKMYIEKAIMLAKQYNLKYQLVDLYIFYGKYMEEYMDKHQNYGQEFIKLTIDIYNKSVSIAKELGIQYLIEKSTMERAGFKTFCQLKSIET